MYLALAVFAGIVGLFIVGASVYTVWCLFHLAGQQKEEQPGKSALELAGHYLLKWTAMDYAGLLLSIIGLLFLLADLIGVIRERMNYPYYHYGYLLCGFVFLTISILFLIMRLTIVLRISRTHQGAGPHYGGEPHQADHAEQRV